MGGNEATNVTAGIWGFLTLFGLAMICWLLYRSMSKHLRNVRLKQDAAEAATAQRRSPSGFTPSRPVPGPEADSSEKSPDGSSAP